MVRFSLCLLLVAVVAASSRGLAADEQPAGKKASSCEVGICCKSATQESDATPHVVSFEAAWCGPCQKMAPIVMKLQEQGYCIRRINIDEDQESARQHGISSIPAFVAVVGGQAKHRIVGATNEDELRKLFGGDASCTSGSVCAACPHASGAVARHHIVTLDGAAHCAGCLHTLGAVANIPAASQSVALIRATYPMQKDKAEALLAFLSAHAHAKVESELHDDALEITTTPEQQMVIGRFISMFLCGEKQTTACSASPACGLAPACHAEQADASNPER